LKLKKPIDTQDHGADDLTHYEVMRSTFLMGSSSLVNIILGIVRNKVIAVLLNPSGIGLLGIYQSILNLVTTVSGMGINESGARQTALAFHTGDKVSVSRTYLALMRIALITGLGGMALLIFLGKWISLFAFGDPGHTLALTFLSVAVLLGAISQGQQAIIQGARKIKSLAKINIFGALWGTLLGLPVIYFWGMRGVVAYLVILSAATLIFSWRYSAKLGIPRFPSNFRDSLLDGRPLLTLGAAFMVGNMAAVAVQFLLRVIILRFLDLNAAGEYQASAILSSVYVGILFKAMATDFYPRLSAASGSDEACVTLVNKQVHTGLLIATPGVLITLAFAPLVMVQFYSKDFLLAADLLRWQIAGVFLMVVTWPMGYVLRAKADGRLFVATELFSGCLQLALAWVGIKAFGLTGIGVAFFVTNAVYAVVIFRIIHKKYRFSLSRQIIRTFILFALAIGSIFASAYVIPGYKSLFSLAVILVVSAFSVKTLDLRSVLAQFIARVRKTT
jgi:PST family polysaccharide transporter